MRSLSITGLFKKEPNVEEMEKQRTNSYPPSQETGFQFIGDAVVVQTEIDPLAEGGGQEADHVHYKTLNWWHCGVLMIAECISLGILSLPHSMAVLGLIPGLISIIGMGLVAGYTGYVIGQFKLKHPQVTSMADAGMILFGPIGRELFGIGQLIVLIFIMAAHVTSFAIMMNVLTSHGACTIIFSVIGVIVSIFCTLPRTLKNISYFSMGSCFSIFTAIFIVIVTLGITKPNPGHMETYAAGTTFANGMVAFLNIVLAYSGHVTYFGFASELKNPRDYTKALLMLQTTAIAVYTFVAIFIYYYIGPNVPAPALSATTPKVRVAAYAVASITIVIAGVVNGSVGAKQIYMRVWAWKKQPKVVQEKSFKSFSSWVAIVVTLWILAWIIAESIPTFEYVLALVAALLSGWYSFGITSILWLHMNKGQYFANRRKICLTVLNCLILALGCFISFVGLYACAKAISDGDSGEPFSCANNDPGIKPFY